MRGPIDGDFIFQRYDLNPGIPRFKGQRLAIVKYKERSILAIGLPIALQILAIPHEPGAAQSINDNADRSGPITIFHNIGLLVLRKIDDDVGSANLLSIEVQ